MLSSSNRSEKRSKVAETDAECRTTLTRYRLMCQTQVNLIASCNSQRVGKPSIAWALSLDSDIAGMVRATLNMRFSDWISCTDQVYISGLPKDTTEEEIEAHFGSIGIIKLDKKLEKKKIWLYKDKATGENKVLHLLPSCRNT